MTVYQVEELSECIAAPTVICLGVFDGVHLAHQQLIKTALQLGDELGLLPLVHTYDPVPACVLRKDQPLCQLTSLQERLLLIEQAGISHVAVSAFTRALQRMSGVDFFEQVLLHKLNAKHIVAGFNHRFGFHADTDVAKLENLCEKSGIGLSVVSPMYAPEGQLISSSAIRGAIMDGKLELAGQMLGRNPDAIPVQPPKST